MKWPRISIITTCYNHEEFIGRTIESVISQGYPNLEFILIDDGSTDGSREVINSFQNQVSEIVTLSGYRSNPCAALNLGFARSTGEILGWLNSDDVLLYRSLFVIGRFMSEFPDVDWVSGVASTLTQDDLIVKTGPRRKSKYEYLAGNWSTLQQESTFFRRRLWHNAGSRFETEFDSAFDVELWSRFYFFSSPVFLEAPIGAFRKGPQSRSTRDRAELLFWADKAVSRMRSRASMKDLFLARFSEVLRSRLLSRFVRLLPDTFFFFMFGFMAQREGYYDFQEGCWKMRTVRPTGL